MDGPIVEDLPVMRSMSPSTVFGEPIEIDFSQTLIKDPSQTVKMTPGETSLPLAETKKRKKPGVVSKEFIYISFYYNSPLNTPGHAISSSKVKIKPRNSLRMWN